MPKRKKKLYIAYGSNLNLAQMARRCPDAEIAGSAELTGYRLRFCGGRTSAVATIEPDDESSVPVLVWSISERDERSLDIYEGYPRLYRKETLLVNMEGRKRRIRAMVYVMNTSGRDYGVPSDGYYHSILEGYRSAGFDENILREAAENERKELLLYDGEDE